MRGLSVSFPSNGYQLQVLRELDLDVASGDIVALVGPSGCGKTTLLNVIAGFITGQGSVVVGDRPPGRRRDLGYMFQSDTLLPWRTLVANVEFALEVRGVSASERRTTAIGLIDRLGLGAFANAYTHQLSGGMAKRATLAQALIHEPPLLLLDEPFGALDAFTRAAVEQDLLGIVERVGCTVLFVTHNLQEAIALSDRVVVMSSRSGNIVADHVVSLPRPRSLLEVQYTGEFARLQTQIWNDLRPEVVAG